MLEESRFVEGVQFEKGSKKVFCKSGDVNTRVTRVSVKVNRSSESKSSLCLSLKRKVEFTLGKSKLAG